jgi:ferric-dicitrate binding protein FerR (iron transport regulator)
MTEQKAQSGDPVVHSIRDPLWNPEHEADADLAKLSATLSGLSLSARGLQEFSGTVETLANKQNLRSRRRAWFKPLLWAACVSMLTLAAGAFWYRLQWPEGAAWSVYAHTQSLPPLQPGAVLSTGVGEVRRIDVARIGRLTLSENSSMRLLTTQSGGHRVQLDHGHLRAKIWAPPGAFGIRSGEAEIIDLGCEFELQRDAADGTVRVYSGWISYRIGSDDLLVPAHYVLPFNARGALSPRRFDAPSALVSALHVLDRYLLEAAHAADITVAADISAAANALAAISRTEDSFMLLSLLTRYPALANTDLYPQFARLQRLNITESHRAAWLRADLQAMNLWWESLPAQPKHWWLNWRDGWL